MIARWLKAGRAVVARLSDRRRELDRIRFGVAEGDAARLRHDWGPSIARYDAYLARRPRDLGVRLRRMKVLLSAGRLDEAEQALRETMVLRPDKAELTGLLEEVMAAQAAMPAALSSLEVADREAEVWRSGKAYDAIRRTLVLPAAPGAAAGVTTTVLVDARSGRGADLHVTLNSLVGLRGDWRAAVVGAAPGTVAAFEGLTLLAGRVTEVDDPGGAQSTGPILLLQAGVAIEPEALGWLRQALDLAGAHVCFADHDCGENREGRLLRLDPALQSAAHGLEMQTNPRPPAMLMFAAGRYAEGRLLQDPVTPESRRALLMDAFADGRVVHVPILAATVVAPVTDRADPPLAVATSGSAPDRILAVIPTRDEGPMLKTMVDSLLATARAPDRLDVVIVDNGSREPATAEILGDLVQRGVEVLRIDEPFNWSRLNNLAAAGRSQDAFLFINNDMEVLTTGWDERVRTALSRPQVGVVGARLLYPTGRIQHAGMALGALDGAPLHEGLGAGAEDGGPLDRWRRDRPAAAVTGAFLAVRREVFHAAGGFDEIHFPVSCNDIDFCLRVRSLGLTVLYHGGLRLIHHESRSRGVADTAAKVRRAEADLDRLREIWGEAMSDDPSRNPAWIAQGTRPFQWIRALGPEELTRYICGAADLWSVRPRQPS